MKDTVAVEEAVGFGGRRWWREIWASYYALVIWHFLRNSPKYVIEILHAQKLFVPQRFLRTNGPQVLLELWQGQPQGRSTDSRGPGAHRHCQELRLHRGRIEGRPHGLQATSPLASHTWYAHISYEVFEALHLGVAVPFSKRDAEIVRDISELKASDRGGMIFQPEPGVYGKVHQIDFTSLYPSIIVKYNLSPDTIEHPELKGFLSIVLSSLLGLRIETKRRKKTDKDYAGIDSVLKWMLVT